MARLRNCDGSHPPAKNFVNNQIHEQCPRYITMNEHEARFLVELYLECRDSKILPFPGSLVQQTKFTVELFDFLDGIKAEHDLKRAQEQIAEAKKASKGK